MKNQIDFAGDSMPWAKSHNFQEGMIVVMVYFDNAATTFPKPQSVSQGVYAGLVTYGGNPGRSGHQLSLKTAEKVYQVRAKVAQMFGAQVENVVFTSNCTHGLNMAIKGAVTSGHVVISNLDHNSVIRPVEALKQSGRITYSVAQICGKTQQEMVSEFQKHIRSDTKAIVCTHGSNVTGDILPIAELSQLCRNNQLLFIVDAAQTAGVLPIDVETMGIDILCTAGHKGLYGPTGTGLLILGSDTKLRTIIDGGTGSNSLELVQPDFYPDRLEAGTVNTVGICGLGAGIDFVRAKGIEKIYRHEMSLCQMAFRALLKMPYVILYDTEFEIGKKTPVLLFNIVGKTSMDVTQSLSNKGFALRGGLHCAPLAHQALGTIEVGGVRFAPSSFNNKQQVTAFIQAIKQVQR